MSTKEIRELKKEIKLKNQYFNNVFNSINNGILIFDERGPLKIYNLFFANIFSKSKKKLNNLGFADIFQHKQRGDLNFDLKKFSKGEEYELVLKNKDQTPVACSFNEIENPESGEKEISVVFTDLTIAKKAEIEKAELQNKLIKGAYRDGVAENAVAVLHNIGNVLTAIIGKTSDNRSLKDFMEITKVLSSVNVAKIDVQEFLGVLKEELEGVSKKFKKDFKFVSEKSSHIADVIAAQQRYANLKHEIKSSIKLQDLISDCLLMHEGQILKRKIKIVRYDEEDIKIFVEKNGMAQTLSNIIVNASESIEEEIMNGGISEGRIEIKTSIDDKMAILNVSDNGTGIKKANIKKIFDYGFSTKERESGFGLHNCANFINRSGGSIKISNNEDTGASVVIIVPRIEKETEELSDCA